LRASLNNTLKEECTLRPLEIRMLRKIFGKREKISGRRVTLHKEELHNL
jgi:hypothetical protein